MNSSQPLWTSTALQANIERTAAVVQIPEKYRILLSVVEEFYGVHKRTEEFLVELNHPYVNWEYIVDNLKTISLGDFHKHNAHAKGAEALRVTIDIYFDVLRSSANDKIKERALKYLFDYVEYILSESRGYLSRNLSLTPFIIESLTTISTEVSLFKKCSGYFKPILKLWGTQKSVVTFEGLETLFYRAFRYTYEYWLTQPDPSGFLLPKEEATEGTERFKDLIRPLSHHHLESLLATVEGMHNSRQQGTLDALYAYLDMPDYFQITKGYLIVADELERSPAYAGHQHLVKLNFLFQIINSEGLADIHGTALREINRSLGLVFTQRAPEKHHGLIKEIFRLLRKSTSRYQYQDIIIDCMSTMAKEIFKTNDHPLVDTFIEQVISFGFQYPDIQGSTADWQVKVNPLHIQNIRAWLEIIALRPRWTKRLLSALIINLKVGGVFVSDTDLLQKDISSLLNSDIKPSYNLVKQLSRMFPIYFREIGAEGELRDASTKIDELSFRCDPLIHFLRKQSHVESNSLLVPFVENIFHFWHSGNKEPLKRFLPQEVYSQLVGSGECFDGVHALCEALFSQMDKKLHALLESDKSTIQKTMNAVPGVNERDRERALLLIRLYQLLYKKYHPGHIDVIEDLETASIFSHTKLQSLRKALGTKDTYKALSIILEFLAQLKDQILSPEKTEAFENIYYKRHIAVGIPSMYGTYSEKKFDALSLSLRLESFATILCEQIITSLNVRFITKSTIEKVHSYLWLFIQALNLEGIATEGLEAKMKMFSSALQVKLFSIDQYINILQFISKDIQDIIKNYYIDAHSANIPVIIHQFLGQNQRKEAPISPPKQNHEEALYQISENFFRSIISSACGLQVLDNLISNILGTLSAESEKLKDRKDILRILMTYNPEIAISPLQKIDRMVDDQVHLGNKGYFLKQLVSFDYPVPPGFIITTEVFRCLEAVMGYEHISHDLSERLLTQLTRLEKMTKSRFGDPENPLLLSVRSGAAISLPGMMDSFLNVGINKAIAERLGQKKKYKWAVWDSYRRFLQMWGMFQGLDRDFFDKIMDGFKNEYQVTKKIEFSADQMREIALAYFSGLEARGVEVVDDPGEQLRRAIYEVFKSWNSPRAKIYRRQLNIADEWGTAVIVQAMVFGNLDKNSGAGVVFTRNPKGTSPAVVLYGDFIFGVQGDDIVSGLVETYPISENQRKEERRGSEISLEHNFPETYAELVRLCEKLIYEKGFNHQEIEFTFENPKKAGLYILQTRDMVPLEEREKVNTFTDTEALKTSLLGIGIGVGGGALSGKATYSQKEIEYFRNSEPDTPLILIRPDTVPDDIGLLLQVDGLLTAKGGSTSHAAVTTPQLQKVGVVGFKKLRVYEAEGYSIVDGYMIRGGDFISIDGWSGAVYMGNHKVEAQPPHKVIV